MIRLRDRYEAFWSGLLYEAAGTGRLHPGIDLRLLRFLLFGAINGVALWYRADGPRTPDEISDAFWGFIAYGVVDEAHRAGRHRLRAPDAVRPRDGAGRSGRAVAMTANRNGGLDAEPSGRPRSRSSGSPRRPSPRAQSRLTGADLRGTVRDQSAAAVPGATVTATAVDTNTSRTAIERHQRPLLHRRPASRRLQDHRRDAGLRRRSGAKA